LSTTYFTVSDARFFTGTVALVNSLRLTGNSGRIVVLDLGLSPAQRERLGGEVELASMPDDVENVAVLCKPFPALLDLTGTVVVIDGDMIVTRSLDPILERAAAGDVCLFSDIPAQRDRWFAEWEQAFGLANPPRRQPYVNAGFLAYSADRWPDLMSRWWEACTKVPEGAGMGQGGTYDQPFWAADQDALNALLMSEIPEESVVGLPEEEGPSAELLPKVTVLDERTLSCELDGYSPYLLHYWGSPKPWERKAWMRVAPDAYVRLLSRVLLGLDAPVPMAPGELPPWLRPGAAETASLRALGGVNRTARAALQRVPPSARMRLGRLVRSFG
jgi:hypothetical protein